MSVERVEPNDAIRERRVESIVVPENEAPAPEVIAARIDLGNAEYHDSCCPFDLWQNDESLFTEMPDCDCGGPALAEAYVEQAERLVQVEAERDALREALTIADRALRDQPMQAFRSEDARRRRAAALDALRPLLPPAADSGTPPAKEAS